MVYLTRTALVKESKWKEAIEFAVKSIEYINNDPLVIKSEILHGINGDFNRIYFVAGFNSLADEEKWAEKTASDPKYQAMLEEDFELFVENTSVDNLYRSLS